MSRAAFVTAVRIIAAAGTLLLAFQFPSVADESGIRYKVGFRGALSRQLASRLRKASSAVSERKHPPDTLPMLNRRMADDASNLIEVMKAEGFYDARITPEIDEQARPVRVTFDVKAGPLYPLKNVEVNLTAGPPELKTKLPAPKGLGLRIGQPARAGDILAAKAKLAQALGNLGYPLPTFREPRVEVDHAARAVLVTFFVDPGLAANFGPTTVAGNKEVAEDFIRNCIQWKEGAPYNKKQVNETQKKLRDSALFSLATVAPGNKVENGAIPMTITVHERKPHTIKAGVSYQTDEGPGGRLTWEDRNIYHHGERLTLNLKVSGIQDYIEPVYFIPQFLRPDQSLRLRGWVGYEDTDAYKGTKDIVEATVERKFSKELVGGTGLAFKTTNETQKNLHLREAYHLVSIPTYMNYDTRDSITDPTKGGLLSLKLTPFQALTNQDLHFVKMFAGYNQHLKVSANPDIVLAGRLALGSVVGADLLAIPPDDRLYAGGGNSVRGYRFQYVGPLVNKKPEGGQSLLELSGEVRVKVTERVGIATFLDGGGAFKNEFPQLDSNIRWGAGIGVRYFSSVGPFRIDVAVPLQPRRGIDDPFQLYVSMGQAF